MASSPVSGAVPARKPRKPTIVQEGLLDRQEGSAVLLESELVPCAKETNINKSDAATDLNKLKGSANKNKKACRGSERQFQPVSLSMQDAAVDHKARSGDGDAVNAPGAPASNADGIGPAVIINADTLAMMRSIEQRLQQLSDSYTCKSDESDAVSQAMCERMSQLSSLASANFAINLQMYQMMAERVAHPIASGQQHSGKRSSTDMDCIQVPTSKSARRRLNNSVKWQQQQRQQKDRMAATADAARQQCAASGIAARSEEAAADVTTEEPAAPTAKASSSLHRSTGASLPQSSSLQASVSNSASRPDMPGTGQVAPWQDFKGAYNTLRDYPGLLELYEDWSEGIKLSVNPIKRQWPLRELEWRYKSQDKQHSVKWRQGVKMRGHISERLTLIYAILQELPDPAGLYSAHDPAVRQAVAKVEAKRLKDNKKMSLKKLAEMLSKDAQVPSNTNFEVQYFGWPPPINMKKKGNPNCNKNA